MKCMQSNELPMNYCGMLLEGQADTQCANVKEALKDGLELRYGFHKGETTPPTFVFQEAWTSGGDQNPLEKLNHYNLKTLYLLSSVL